MRSVLTGTDRKGKDKMGEGKGVRSGQNGLCVILQSGVTLLLTIVVSLWVGGYI